MARFILTTQGSLGDLHPYLAMARVLRHAGCEVVLATNQDYRDRVVEAGCAFVPLAPCLTDLGPEEQWAAQAMDLRKGSEFVFRRAVMPYLETNFRTLSGVLRPGDVLIGHLLSFATVIAAEKAGLKWIGCVLQPSTFLSAMDPPVLGPAQWLIRLARLGPVVYRIFYRLGRLVTWGWLGPWRRLRRDLGLPRGANPVFAGFSPHGNLALFPAAFAAPQADWPPRTEMVGFPLLDTSDPERAQLSPALAAFLAVGPPPVVFTLGSMVAMMETDFYAVAAAALRQLGLRGVFVAGSAQRGVPESARSDPALCVTGYEPYSALFARCRAVVHQCGIGTMSQALAAGVPQVLVPFAHDQPDNASRLARLGVGVVVQRRELSPDRLAAAVSRALGADMVARAAELAPVMAGGVFAAALRQALARLGVLPSDGADGG